MLTMTITEDEIVQIYDGNDQILIKAKRHNNQVRLTIMADRKWRIHRGSLKEAKATKATKSQ